MSANLDLDDTTRCPIGPACETCGGRAAPACDMPDGCGAAEGQPCEPGCPSLATDPDPGVPTAFLAVATAVTPVGVFCLMLCGRCADAGELPRLPSWAEACRRVGQHCEHLDCDVDQMAAALDAGSAPESPEERGCDACRVVGPLLVAPGTSGRTWKCECGEVWSHSPTTATDASPEATR